MITVTIEFSYQEQHKVRDNLTYSQKTFLFQNADEERGFYKGLNEAVGKIYEDYEVKSSNEDKPFHTT